MYCSSSLFVYAYWTAVARLTWGLTVIIVRIRVGPGYVTDAAGSYSGYDWMYYE